jgi:hypothetical protein
VHETRPVQSFRGGVTLQDVIVDVSKTLLTSPFSRPASLARTAALGQLGDPQGISAKNTRAQSVTAVQERS